MSPRAERPVLWLALVSAMALMLAGLAFLQYRWSEQVSVVERGRIEAALRNSVSQFRQEFYRELVQVCMAFQPGSWAAADDAHDLYARRFEQWLSTAQYPDLVSGLYVLDRQSEGAQVLLEWKRDRQEFGPATDPARFTPVIERVDASRVPPAFRMFQGRLFTWYVAGRVPVLVHRLPAERRLSPRRLSDWLLIELSPEFLEREFLPELAQRYFGGSDSGAYHVAVLSGHEIIFQTPAELPPSAYESPDVLLPLLWASSGPPPRFGLGPREGGPPDRSPSPSRRGRGVPLFLISGSGDGWELAVKHRMGSLDAVVAAFRRRNLAVSFGTLTLLGISMALIMISARRAQRLARAQVEFVAGVSHELRTPLAVIRSAADNLAEGVIDSADRVKEYGALIRSQSRRLSEMIEQTLRFAVHQGRLQYSLLPHMVEEIVDTTLEKMRSAVEEAGFSVERSVDPGLPPVLTDSEALSQCLENLVGNAIKYGLAGRWVAVRASLGSRRGADEVELSVEDRGAGIDPSDLPHIFEPFYRGRSARDAQIRGAGLGLSLARDSMKALGGGISVESAPGQGTRFTLHVPVATVNGRPAPASQN